MLLGVLGGPGRSWGGLGGSGAVPGGSSKSFGQVSAGSRREDEDKIAIRRDLELSWRLLGPSWGELGAFLGRLCAIGPTWGGLGAILGPSWRHLGPSWGHLGRSRAILKRKSDMPQNLQKPKENRAFWAHTGSRDGSNIASWPISAH